MFRCSSRRGAGAGDEADRCGAGERLLCSENTRLHAAALGTDDSVCTVTSVHPQLSSSIDQQKSELSFCTGGQSPALTVPPAVLRPD